MKFQVYSAQSRCTQQPVKCGVPSSKKQTISTTFQNTQNAHQLIFRLGLARYEVVLLFALVKEICAVYVKMKMVSVKSTS